MSLPKRNYPNDLWKRLALFRDRPWCRADWRRHLGGAFDAVMPFLTERPGTVASTYPDPDTGLPLIPRLAPDGTFTAFPADPEVTRIDPITRILPQDVSQVHVNWEAICLSIASALHLEGHHGPGPLQTSWLQEVGICRGKLEHRTALLFITGHHNEALAWLRLLVKDSPHLFVLPFHDQLFESLAVSHHHEYLALDRDAHLNRIRSRWELSITQTHSPTSPATVSPSPTKPLVKFSDGFKTVNCTAWTHSESRQRAREQINILRALYENAMKCANVPMPVERLLKGGTSERLDKALDRKKYPQTFALLSIQTDNKTGRRTVCLSDEYDYESH